MQALIFDNNESHPLHSQLYGILKKNGYSLYNGLKTDLLWNLKLPDETIIIINSNIQKNSFQETDYYKYALSIPNNNFTGIELLKIFRINNIDNHIIIFGKTDINNILRSYPKHFILCSPGTTYLKLPYSLKPLDTNDLTNLSKSSNVRSFLKISADINDIRHEVANWWSVKRLYDIHNILTAENDKKDSNYPEYVHSKQNEFLPSLIRYLYERPAKNIKKIACDHKILLSPGDKYFPDNSHNNNSELLHSKKVSLIDAINYIQIYLRKTAGPSVLVLDDKADLMWSETYAYIIHSKKEITINSPVKFSETITYKSFSAKDDHPLLTSISDFSSLDKDRDTRHAFLMDLKDFIKEKYDQLDIILLDIRLTEKDNNYNDINKVNGTLLLKTIKKNYPEIPVIITTASNKFNSFFELTKTGNEGYWVKEGLDERIYDLQSIENYYKLIYLIDRYTSGEYKALKKLGKAIREIKASKGEGYWWKEPDWKGRKNQKARMSQLMQILEYIFGMYHYYLVTIRPVVYGSNSHPNWTTYSDLVHNIGKVVEEIHRVDLFKWNTKIIKVLRDERNDIRGASLYDLRGKASHIKSGNKFDNEKTRKAIISLCNYIDAVKT